MKVFPKEWYNVVSTRRVAKDAIAAHGRKRSPLDPEPQIAAMQAWIDWADTLDKSKLTYVREDEGDILVVKLSSGEVYREDEPL